MRSRFFGASSYDDDEDEDELDLSGFVTSSETQPVIVERSRNKSTSSESAATEPSNMGNAGPRTVPPPMTDMGYRPHFRSPVELKDSGAGNPWNPLWASDDALLKKPAIISKSVGMLGIAGGIAYAAGKRNFRGVSGKIIVGSTALYVHPALGWNHGQLDKLVGNLGVVANYSSKVIAQAIGVIAFHQLIKRA
jgi:hypothetical protein